MMDAEAQLKLQAYLDGELPAREARRVADRLARDAEMQGLLAELQQVRALVQENELIRPLPEEEAFYWHQIQRRLRTTRPVSSPQPSWRWIRWLASVGAAALLAAALVPFSEPDPATQSPMLALNGTPESEVPSANASFITFRSEAQGMSVVWVNTQGGSMISPSN